MIPTVYHLMIQKTEIGVKEHSEMQTRTIQNTVHPILNISNTLKSRRRF